MNRLTDQELRALQNMCNESEQAAEEIEELRFEMESLVAERDAWQARAALAEPAAEPVSEKFCDAHCVWTNHHPDCPFNAEPVAFVIDNGTPEGATEWIPASRRVMPLETGDLLYAHPPRTPLTDALRNLADAADAVGVSHFDNDDLPPEVEKMQFATAAARLALGSNKESE